MAMDDVAVQQQQDQQEATNGWYENFYKWLCTNYTTIAYCIVIFAYMIGFAEYLYLRLTAYFIPEVTIYRRYCDKRSEERIGKTGVHYITILVSFIVIGLIQLFTFFLLTISSRLPPEGLPESVAPQTAEVLFTRSVREKMNKTLYPTFIVYIMCSIIVCATLFYMIGVNDTMDKGLSFVVLILFDIFVVLYFVAFPLIAICYCPDLTCRRRRQSQSADDHRPTTLHKDISSGNIVRLINYTRSPRSAVPLRIPKIVTTV